MPTIRLLIRVTEPANSRKQRIRTGPYVILRLKAGHASKTAHSKEKKEGLRGVAYDNGLWDDHLQDTESR
jgi:hypothetical protein